MIYVPNDTNFKYCPHIYNANQLRVYDRNPQINSTANYRDYFFNSSYIYNSGTQNFGQYAVLPTCIDSASITHNVFYRLDIDKILICFIILMIICFYFPFKIISRLFGRWFKL